MAITAALTREEIRVMGCLLEKAVTTPEQYPLTLNALTLACNQKSSRDPVMLIEQGKVERTARELSEKHLVSVTEGKNGVSKYAHRLCNTLLSDLKLNSAEYAVLCVLLLRGPQTPGELRTRCARLHGFDDNDSVKTVLQALIGRDDGAIVARLPRRPGRQDHEYTHLFAGEQASVAEQESTSERPARMPQKSDRITQLEARIATLERALRALAARLGEQVDLSEPLSDSAADAANTTVNDTPSDTVADNDTDTASAQTDWR